MLTVVHACRRHLETRLLTLLLATESWLAHDSCTTCIAVSQTLQCVARKALLVTVTDIHYTLIVARLVTMVPRYMSVETTLNILIGVYDSLYSAICPMNYLESDIKEKNSGRIHPIRPILSNRVCNQVLIYVAW